VRALGFWQPVAELIVAGVKCTETRGRPIRTLVGERIAVHANLTTEYDRLRWDWPWREYDLRDLPHGALVGTVRVVDCLQMTVSYVRWMRERHAREHAMGDYAVGRWAFRLEDPVRFPVPVPWRGSQGVFMVPDQVVASAACTRCAGGVITVPSGCFSSSLRPCPECRPEEARAMLRGDVFRESGVRW
jgi:hypothetical protein